MERITFEGLFCDIAQCVGQPGNTSECPGGYCDQRRTWERLKEYEDTGLTPEQVPIQKWVSVTDRLPIAEYEEHRRKWGTDPEFIVAISGAEESSTLHFGTDFKGRYCWYDEDSTYSVSYWMNWPVTPKGGRSMKTVLISINKPHTDNIFSGNKSLERRKNLLRKGGVQNELS